MKIQFKNINKLKGFLIFLAGGITILLFNLGMNYTSDDEFCNSCHMHPHADKNWRFSSHYYNKSGVVVHCIECHLPPEGYAHLSAKITTGLRDVWGTLLNDSEDVDWFQKSTREAAVRHVYKAACINCHQNLFPPELSKKGEDAHLYYERRSEQLRCINCHLDVGHYRERKEEVATAVNDEIYLAPAFVDSFENFVEMIPETRVDFEMIAIPGGRFMMGSPEDESFRNPDEGPVNSITISPFWMGKTEVSWLEYEAFYSETHHEKPLYASLINSDIELEVDGITGPTAPYGNPDQGWGRGRRPAITMTHYAAEQYCIWLSEKTGKHYRLPTEAEWEYASRAGTTGPYFFEGHPNDYSSNTFFNNLFGADTAKINTYVNYQLNSGGRTKLPDDVEPNAYGLVHMLGNVREFCLDLYADDTYSSYRSGEILLDPRGSDYGEEHVVRGGSYHSDASDLRVANRDHTRFDSWMLTDPQIPKSKWWYSDCIDVGFRVVCEFKPTEK